MGTSEARARLREILGGTTCTPAMPVDDVLTARIAQEAGWEVCKVNGSQLKATNYGLADGIEGLVNVTDYADAIWRIRRTVRDVVLIVDADDCGGTPETVTRWVADLEAAGVSGIEVEDLGYLPAAELGNGTQTRIHPLDLQVANLKAAVAARNDPSTVILARTVVFNPTSVDGVEMPVEEARERVRAYAETGVDAIAILAEVSRMRSVIETVRSVTDLPLVTLRMLPELIQDEQFLAENNVRIRYISGAVIFGEIVPFVFDLMKKMREDRDGILAMGDTDKAYAALSLVTTPRYRRHSAGTSSSAQK